MSLLFKYASAAHRKVAKVIGLALVAGDFSAWHQAKLLLCVHLNAQERAALAFAALTSLDINQRAIVAQSTLPADDSIGAPLPTVTDLQDDAAWWVSNADSKTREIYMLACFNALPDDRKRAFSQYINMKDAA